MHISLTYSSKEYQEIINVRGFDFDSMFSGIGGFVGIFLGYSILQVADLLNVTILYKLVDTFFVGLSFILAFFTLPLEKGLLD